MSQRLTRRRAAVAGLAVTATVVLAACTGAPAPSSATSSAPTSGFTVLTPKPTKDAGDVVWATYRETQTLDPIQAFDYPENTIDPLLCDSLLRQNPDMSIVDGLTSYTNPSPTEFDFTVNPKATFWDGSPVTAEDAVFSLKRAADPKAGGFYAAVFERVSSIDVTGDKTFTIKLSKPDYWLLGELSTTAGEVVQKKYVQAKGKDFGTVSGGTMCSGPFKLDSWQTGKGVKVVPNPTYWDSTLPKPRLTSLTLIGVPDDATLTAGLKTGSIDGAYAITLTTLGQLETDSSVKVYQGAPYASAAEVVSATKGPLANPTVRQALSYAVDRTGLINTVFRGAANLPHALAAQGSWGYAQQTFSAGYDALPVLDQDVTKAKQLAQQAGVAGQTIKLGTSSGIPALNTETLAIKAAAESIGLKVTLVNVSPSNYINFFIDPKAWSSVDAFATTNYGDYADPSALYKSLAYPNGSQDFSGWTDPQVTASLEAARSEADPTKRAQDTVDAQKGITEALPWIPLAAPNTVLVMHRSVTGAPATFQYMFGPWAVYLGGTGS
jgi:peptide/nickel transport system substrate-binding protein